MAQKDKSLFGAYFSALFGFLLGLPGMHRFYLGQWFMGLLITGVFLLSVALMAFEYYEFVTQMLGVVAVLGGGGGQVNFGDIPDISQEIGESLYFYWGARLFWVVFVWWALEMLFLPLVFRRYRARLAPR